MSTFREIVYMCSDQLKISSDDNFFTNDHILYLIKKYRGLYLSQKYKDVRKEIPESNYQTICLDLTKTPAMTGESCEGGTLLRTTNKLPTLMTIGTTSVYPVDYFVGDITLVTRERMKYVGYNRWLQNIIYCAIAPDSYLYLKSSNPQYLHMEKIRLTGIFEDPEEAEKLTCDKDGASCDILDRRFPLEEEIVPQLIDTVVKFMTSGLYKPEDTENNANDDLSTMMAFIRQNMKSNLQKQIEGNG
jgi:hypothetical protein